MTLVLVFDLRTSGEHRDPRISSLNGLLPENDSCDWSVLLECRRNKSLIMLRDRTERERDELRAACRRRREEAAVRDKVEA